MFLCQHIYSRYQQTKRFLETHDVTKHQVGPVLGPDGKSLSGQYKNISSGLSHIEALDQERNDPQESEEVRLARLDTLVSAQVLFDPGLLTPSPASKFPI